MMSYPASYSDVYFVRLVDADGKPTAERKVHSVTHFTDAADAAEFFASELVSCEMRDQRASEEDMGHWHRTVYVIEARHPKEEEWVRFSVRCECKLEFASTKITTT